jgi:hypothetical protein
MFDASFFTSKSPEQVARLEGSYVAAQETGFSRAYDDEDLTMLIALGLYAELIMADDDLLNPANAIGFVTPTEWLQYAASVIENSQTSPDPYGLNRLRSLFVRCIDALQEGSPTAFVDFRRAEERELRKRAMEGSVVLNKSVIEFLNEITRFNAAPIGFSDRPNASLGLETNSDQVFTTDAVDESLFYTPLTLA